MNLNSKIGLGTVQFGMPYGISNNSGQTTITEIEKILLDAEKKGISFIDTGSVYGTAESLLGNNNLTCFNIISKYMPPTIDESLEQQFNRSLNRLKVNSLYGYLAHRPLDLLHNKKQWDWLLTLKDTGKVEKIGYSLNQVHELEQLLTAGMFPDLVQVPFNFFDDRFKNLMIELKAKGCEIHTRSTFLQGLFFMDVNNLPDFFNKIKPHIKELQKAFPQKLSGALLKYVLSLEFVDIVIMGVENLMQFTENIEQISGAEEIYIPTPEIDEVFLMPSMWPKV